MKNILTIFIGIVLIGLISSCSGDDFLDAPVKSTLDESVIFATPGLARGAVDGILEPMGQTNSYRGRFIPFYGFNTDSEWNYSSSSAGSSQGELMIYDLTPSNSQMNSANNAWAMMYLGIERANICIRGLRTFGDPTPGTELGQLLGEALTLRAVYYADLMKAWGDVPARFEPISSETLYLPKTNRDEIYKQLLADLEEAATLVPWPNTSSTSSSEDINKAFIKGLRARLALVASGFMQYPDTGIRRSNDPDLSVANMYQLALDECNDIINSGTCKLDPSFEELWRKHNGEDLSASNESLWEIPFSSGRGRVLFSFAVRHRSVDQYTGQPRGGIAGPLPNVFYDYDAADTRRDVTCVPYQWGNAVDGFAQQELVGLGTWYFGKYRYEWMNRYVTSTNDDGVNFMYMRYAEILLMAAETANELNGPDAARSYLKTLRRRAFPEELHAEKVDAYVDGLATKEEMFQAIIKEHKYEFTGEMLRKQALIRWNMLKSNLDEAIDRMTNLKNRTGDYADVPTTLYYQYEEDGETLDIYGLERGETQDPGSAYSAVDWTILEDVDINSLYAPGADPDNRQFWPIWQIFIDGSNGQLENDYGY